MIALSSFWLEVAPGYICLAIVLVGLVVAVRRAGREAQPEIDRILSGLDHRESAHVYSLERERARRRKYMDGAA